MLSTNHSDGLIVVIFVYVLCTSVLSSVQRVFIPARGGVSAIASVRVPNRRIGAGAREQASAGGYASQLHPALIAHAMEQAQLKPSPASAYAPLTQQQPGGVGVGPAPFVYPAYAPPDMTIDELSDEPPGMLNRQATFNIGDNRNYAGALPSNTLTRRNKAPNVPNLK